MKKFTFFLLGVLIYASADAQSYYRSAANGNWASLTTWEQSPDNVNWATATTVPDQTATSIVVRTGNTVTIAALAAAQTLTIENGGVLQQNAPLAIHNGPTAHDLYVAGTLVVNTGIPTLVGGATVRVHTGTGIVRVDENVSGNSMFARNNPSVVFGHRATFEWKDNLAFSTSNATYFLGNHPDTIAIFKITGSVSVGADDPTIINGLLVVDGSVSWANDGTKTFRNGISATGTITQTGIGRFLVNGTTSTLGGTGTLVLNSAGGLTISNSSCTLESSKVINGGPITVENGSTLDAGVHSITGTASLTLRAGTTLISASSTGVSGSIACSGAKTFENGSNYTFDGAVSQNTGTLPAQIGTLTIANTGALGSERVTLGTTTQASTLTLNDGILNTKSYILTIPENGIVTGGSDESYVYGKLHRHTSAVVPTQYEFPVGDIAKVTNPYKPISIVTVGNGGDEFTAEYIFAPPPPPVDNVFLNTLTGLANAEYWNVEKVGTQGTTGRVLIPYTSSTTWRTVSYETITPCTQCLVAITQLDDLNWDFTGMVPGNTESPPLYRVWTEPGVLSSETVATFGTFSVGFSYDLILPIKSLVLKTERSALIWNVESHTPIKTYIVEYEKRGAWVKEYETLETTHTPKHNGLYRVKAVSVFDQEVVSNQVYFNNRSERLLFLFPNPVTNTSVSVYSDVQQRATIETFDGRVIWKGMIQKGITILSLDYPSGMYLLRGNWGIQKFIIQ